MEEGLLPEYACSAWQATMGHAEAFAEDGEGTEGVADAKEH